MVELGVVEVVTVVVAAEIEELVDESVILGPPAVEDGGAAVVSPHAVGAGGEGKAQHQCNAKLPKMFDHVRAP